MEFAGWMLNTWKFVECGRGSWAIREVVGGGGSWGWERGSRRGKGIKFSRREIRRASELRKRGVAVGLEEGIIGIFDRIGMSERERGGELGKSGDGVAHGKEDARRIVRKREFGGESFAGSRQELEGGEIGDGGWGISLERGCRGKSGMGRGSKKLGRRMKPRISRGERKNRDQREGRERENRGCRGEWRRGEWKPEERNNGRGKSGGSWRGCAAREEDDHWG